jgi:peptide/nickel transport system substrate-binding protein
MRRNIRWTRGLAATVAALAAIAGVGAGAGAGTTEPPAPAGTGERLVVGNSEEPTLGFYPPTSAVGDGGNTIAMGIFDTLTVVDNEGKTIPYLVESMEPNEDNTVWTIALREGILFADGTPLDAAALKDNFDRMDAAGRPIQVGFTSEVIDEMTLEVTFLAPYGAFPEGMSSPYAWIASPTAMAAMTEEEFDVNPIGTGPYIIKEWVRDDHLTLERNPYYWRADEGLPYYDEMEFRPIVDDAARLAALEAGDVDIIPVGGGDIATMLERTDEFNVYSVNQGVDAMLYNNSIAPFDDVRVRRGLSLALDAEALILGAFDGVGVRATAPMPNDNPFASEWEYPRYDPEQGQALIEEYEAETGTEVAFTLSFGQGTSAAEVAQLAQQYWGDIGVEVELDGPITASDFPGIVATHEYEAAVYGVPGFVDPDVWLYIEFRSDSFLNLAAINEPAIDEALDIAHGSVDFEERKAAYADVQAVLAEGLQWFFFRDSVAVVASQLDVVGVDEFPLLDGTYGFSKQAQFYTPFAPESLRPAGT